tara:strand:+ start:445 stop:993 length:549 start_codon:yes stop_codon:yes gene_type:complete
MQKVVLSEISLIYGDVKTPKGFEIDQNKIKNDIISSYANGDRISSNPLDYSYNDYKVPFSKKLQWLLDYIRDHFRIEYGKNLILKSTFANVLNKNENSLNRSNVDPVDLRNAPDYTCVYGVDIEGEGELVIEYEDGRKKGRTWHIPLKSNNYYIFPSILRYFFKAPNKNKLTTILTITYESV